MEKFGHSELKPKTIKSLWRTMAILALLNSYHPIFGLAFPGYIYFFTVTPDLCSTGKNNKAQQQLSKSTQNRNFLHAATRVSVSNKMPLLLHWFVSYWLGLSSYVNPLKSHVIVYWSTVKVRCFLSPVHCLISQPHASLSLQCLCFFILFLIH